MPLRVTPLLESDIAAFAALDDAAMRDWSLAKAMANANKSTGQSREEMITGWMQRNFSQPDPNVHWLKVVDDELDGRMVGAGCWKFEQVPPAKVDQDDVENEAPAPKEVKEPGEPKKLSGPGSNGVFVEMAKDWEEFKKEFYKDQPYANLQVLVTHPDHQRRGAGSMIIDWGANKADEQGMVSVLQASKAGESLYRKHGFEIVRMTEIDLRPYGVDDTELRRGMMRQPRKKA